MLEKSGVIFASEVANSAQSEGDRLKGKSLSIGSALSVRPYAEDDAEAICAWVNANNELPLISGDTGALRPKLLDRWVEEADGSYVLVLAGMPVAFATASEGEWRFPKGLIELCHLIVAPEYRRLYHGSFLCQCIAKSILLDGRARGVAGRVVLENDPALSLMKYLRWKEVTDKYAWAENTSFRWFLARDPKPSAETIQGSALRTP